MHVDKWLVKRGIEKGAVLSLEQCWDFAQDWYRDRGQPDWQPKTAEETQAIFDKNGMTGDFWRVV